MEQQLFRNFFVPVGEPWVFRSLYLPKQGVGYQIDVEDAAGLAGARGIRNGWILTTGDAAGRRRGME